MGKQTKHKRPRTTQANAQARRQQVTHKRLKNKKKPNSNWVKSARSRRDCLDTIRSVASTALNSEVFPNMVARLSQGEKSIWLFEYFEQTILTPLRKYPSILQSNEHRYILAAIITAILDVSDHEYKNRVGHKYRKVILASRHLISYWTDEDHEIDLGTIQPERFVQLAAMYKMAIGEQKKEYYSMLYEVINGTSSHHKLAHWFRNHTIFMRYFPDVLAMIENRLNNIEQFQEKVKNELKQVVEWLLKHAPGKILGIRTEGTAHADSTNKEVTILTAESVDNFWDTMPVELHPQGFELKQRKARQQEIEEMKPVMHDYVANPVFADASGNMFKK